MKTELVNGFAVNTWWDRQSRNWITQILTPEEYQYGVALFSGNKQDAEYTHQIAVEFTAGIVTEAE